MNYNIILLATGWAGIYVMNNGTRYDGEFGTIADYRMSVQCRTCVLPCTPVVVSGIVDVP